MAWPDRIASAFFGNDYTTVIASSESHFAVGLRSGTIIIYGVTTCQETCRITTEERLKCLKFANSRSWLVAASRETLSVHNYETGQELWTKEANSVILALVVTKDDSDIIAVTQDKFVDYWNIKKSHLTSRRHLERSKIPGPPQKVVRRHDSMICLIRYLY